MDGGGFSVYFHWQQPGNIRLVAKDRQMNREKWIETIQRMNAMTTESEVIFN